MPKRQRRRYGDPEDVAWPYPRRQAPRPSRPIAKPLPPVAPLPAYKPGQKGSKHGRAKLTEKDVEQIKILRPSGWTYMALAREFKVSRSTICQILSGTSWQHLAGSPPTEGTP